MNSGEPTRHAIIVKRKDTSDQTVKQNHSRIIQTTKEDQEISNKQDQGLQGTVITVENQDISKQNAEQESTHWNSTKNQKQKMKVRRRKSLENTKLLETP